MEPNIEQVEEAVY